MSPPKRRRLDPITVARVKHTGRCPDCPSRVDVIADGCGPGLHDVRVHHAPTCPTLGNLRRDGRHQDQLVAVRGPDETPEAFERKALAAAAEMATAAGQPVNVFTSPYDNHRVATRRPERNDQ